MSVYQYTARDRTGNEFRGVYANIESVGALREELGRLGCVLIRARPERPRAKARRRIAPREVASFAYQFAGMYTAGLPLVTCLETLETQLRGQALQEVLADVRRRVQAGASLTAACACHRRVFSDFFLGMISAGETAGKLSQALELSAQFLEKRLDLNRRMRAAFVYPTVVGAVCLLVVIGLLIFIVPTFSQLYARLHVALPGPTRMLVGVSSLLRHGWWCLLPVLAGLAVGARRLLGDPRVRARWDRWKTRVPLLGPLHRLVLVSQFLRTFGMLISVGVPLVDALAAAGQVTRNQEMASITTDVQQGVRAGHSLAASLGVHSLFPPLAVQLVAAGEEAGILADMLKKGADLLDKEAERLTAALLLKLEPALTVLMGLLVGLILMGVYLPMFDYMASMK